MVITRLIRSLCIALCFCLLLNAPGAVPGAFAAGTQAVNTGAAVSAFGFYFDTMVYVTAYGADETLLTDIWELCTRYELLFSRTREGSDVDRINHAEGQTVTVDHETWVLISRALEYNKISGGMFSVSIAPVVSLWSFTGADKHMAAPKDLERALPLVNDDAIVLGEQDTVTMPAGMAIDLGGIAKGYVADQIAAMAKDRCTGCGLSVGGNTYAIGSKPDGTAWTVNIQSPDAQLGAADMRLTLPGSLSVVTSGTYQRYFEQDGVRYHHILDPRTGYPSQTDVVSATLITPDSTAADALATVCVLLGSDAAVQLMTDLGMDAVLILTDGKVVCTPGLVDKYSLINY